MNTNRTIWEVQISGTFRRGDNWRYRSNNLILVVADTPESALATVRAYADFPTDGVIHQVIRHSHQPVLWSDEGDPEAAQP